MAAELYRSLGCGACHTSLVRPLAIDAGLGPVTIADANRELGYRRLGPDLSDVANRVEDASMYASALSGAGGHPAYTGLSDEDVANLVAYLSATNFTPEESTEEDTES
jgi:mono/diheme cytochrome c family protein